MEDSNIIKIVAKNGKEIELEKKATELSELLKQTINDFPDEEKFPLNEIEEKEALKIKEYLTHFNGIAPPEIEKPLISNNLKDITDEWSADFLYKMSLEEIINLNIAANYMGIYCLLDLCCAKIATLLKDKSEEEVLKEFNITEPLTEEEKNKIREENKWIEENI